MTAEVLHLVRRSHAETVETLKWMLKEAERGRQFDFAGWMLDDDGGELAIFTGVYRADSSKALMAAMRMSMHLTMAHDGLYGPP